MKKLTSIVMVLGVILGMLAFPVSAEVDYSSYIGKWTWDQSETPSSLTIKTCNNNKMDINFEWGQFAVNIDGAEIKNNKLYAPYHEVWDDGVMWDNYVIEGYVELDFGNDGIWLTWLLNENGNAGTPFSGWYVNPSFKLKYIEEKPVPIYVTIDGTQLHFDQSPIMQNDRVMVPMRTIFEVLGATVTWDGNNQTINASKDNDKIIMKIGNTSLVKNEEYITLDVAPALVGDRTLVPVRAVAESFDASVNWNGDTNTVEITNKVIPKKYTSKTLTRSPMARNIVVNNENDIFFIDENKIMKLKNGIASTYKESLEMKSDKGTTIQTEIIYNLVYSIDKNEVLAICKYSHALNRELWDAYVIQGVDSGTVYAKSDGHYDLMFATYPVSNFTPVMNEGNLYYVETNDHAHYIMKADLQAGNISVVTELPEIKNTDMHYAFSKDFSLLIPTNDILDLYSFTFGKNEFNKITCQNYKSGSYSMGVQGNELCFFQDGNLYSVDKFGYVTQTLASNEIEYKDNSSINATEFVFDNLKNIVFYDSKTASIRMLRKNEI